MSGVPVYLAGGVIITSAGQPLLGFWMAATLCVAVCFGIKVLAICMQQKGFGESMSGFVRIRYTVGVNSVTIRAIQRILEQPGLKKDKVGAGLVLS